MFESLNLKKEAFGLDVSDLSLKIAKLKKSGDDLKLESFGCEKIDQGIIKEGEIKDQKKLAEIIKKSLKNACGKKIKTKYVVASLPEEKTFLQVIKMPALSEEELKSAVFYEAENYIPMSINDVYLDFQPVASSNVCSCGAVEENQEILIAAIPKKIADDYSSCLKLAGLEPIAFEVESQAISRAIIKEKLEDPVAILDLGESRTIFVVFCGGSIRFTASIPISGYLFKKIIAQDLGVDMEKAETLIARYGIKERMRIRIKEEVGAEITKGEIFQALIPPLIDMVQQVKKYMDFYQSPSCQVMSKKIKKIKKLIICGGGASLKGLENLLSLELKSDVEIAAPWIGIANKQNPDMPMEKSLKYATALGLARRALNEE
ncbi:MAG: type IV pilus assembly protein PilM [Candidatus Pacebacteria bacterium]|nr:type IV pilus assembly protein PilM [Candidatus Paceibacterota bacterium]MDD4875026.1 type IV pilus assembly protein PilM [Candidatus Paceibacterota bacterium]